MVRDPSEKDAHNRSLIDVESGTRGDHCSVIVPDDGQAYRRLRGQRVFNDTPRLEFSRCRDGGGARLDLQISARIVRCPRGPFGVDEPPSGRAQVAASLQRP